jgi:hypothetical protein
VTGIEETWIRERVNRIKDPWMRGNQLDSDISKRHKDYKERGDSNRDSGNI